MSVFLEEWCRGRREGYLGRLHVVIIVGIVAWNEGSGYAHIVVALVEGERDGGCDAPGIVGKGSSGEDDLSEVLVAARRWQVGGNKVGESVDVAYITDHVPQRGELRGVQNQVVGTAIPKRSIDKRGNAGHTCVIERVMGEGELVRDYDVRVRLEGGLICLTKSGVVAHEWGRMIVEVCYGFSFFPLTFVHLLH